VTWWAQVVENGVGSSEPEEADLSRLREMLAGIDAVIAPDGDAVLRDLPVALKAAEPIPALAAARYAMRFDNPADMPPPRPIYVRAPDATPMVRP
jgi:hypothetical protein